jgi:hypothetical protein
MYINPQDQWWPVEEEGPLNKNALYRKKRMKTMAEVLRAYGHTEEAIRMEEVEKSMRSPHYSPDFHFLFQLVAKLLDIPNNVSGYQARALKELCEHYNGNF